MKRIMLFILTNLAVMLVLTVVTRLLGVDRFLTANGVNLGSLLVFSAVLASNAPKTSEILAPEVSGKGSCTVFNTAATWPCNAAGIAYRFARK